MAILTTFAASNRSRLSRLNKAILLAAFTMLFGACSKSSQPMSGAQKRVQIAVGEIKEISLPSRGDASVELIGTSDNQEVVEVSRQALTPAVDTLKRTNSGPTVFQLKGITIGTANVIFTQKTLGATNPGETIRTYIVQVRAK